MLPKQCGSGIHREAKRGAVEEYSQQDVRIDMHLPLPTVTASPVGQPHSLA